MGKTRYLLTCDNTRSSVTGVTNKDFLTIARELECDEMGSEGLPGAGMIVTKVAEWGGVTVG